MLSPISLYCMFITRLSKSLKTVNIRGANKSNEKNDQRFVKNFKQLFFFVFGISITQYWNVVFDAIRFLTAWYFLSNTLSKCNN